MWWTYACARSHHSSCAGPGTANPDAYAYARSNANGRTDADCHGHPYAYSHAYGHAYIHSSTLLLQLLVWSRSSNARMGIRAPGNPGRDFGDLATEEHLH